MSSVINHLFLVRRLFVEDDAQDLIEYAFMAAFLATAGYVTLNALGGDIFNAYSSWLDPATGVPYLWEPAPPMSSGS